MRHSRIHATKKKDKGFKHNGSNVLLAGEETENCQPQLDWQDLCGVSGDVISLHSQDLFSWTRRHHFGAPRVFPAAQRLCL